MYDYSDRHFTYSTEKADKQEKMQSHNKEQMHFWVNLTLCHMKC